MPRRRTLSGETHAPTSVCGRNAVSRLKRTLANNTVDGSLDGPVKANGDLGDGEEVDSSKIKRVDLLKGAEGNMPSLNAVATRYFEDSSAKSTTSNNTLSNLPSLDYQRYTEILSKLPSKHSEEIRHLDQLYESCFSQWQFELSQGFNLLCYGYGSKKALLERFVNDHAATAHPLLIVNGYFPSVTIKHILTTISSTIYGIASPPASLIDHVNMILNIVSDHDSRHRPRKLYLLIHNIDGPNLRIDKAQDVLSLLAQHPNVHIIASADHINCALLWDSSKASRFQWVWHDVTTFCDYAVETSYENSIMILRSDVTARSTITVLSSLPENSRQCFKTLANHQLTSTRHNIKIKKGGKKGTSTTIFQGNGNEESPDSASSAEHGLPYSTFYTKCREAFIVGNESNFKTILTEFRDHKIIASVSVGATKREFTNGIAGADILYIPLDHASLEVVLATFCNE